MALDKVALKDEFKTALIATAGALDNSATDLLAETLADVIVDHLRDNAVVTVAAGIPVSTTGTAAAQTGATTAPGTGTLT